MLEMKKFAFYGEPIKISTYQWEIKFVSSPKINTSIVQVFKKGIFNSELWCFEIIKTKGEEIKFIPIKCQIDDGFISRRNWALTNCSKSGNLNWQSFDRIMDSIIHHLSTDI